MAASLRKVILAGIAGAVVTAGATAGWQWWSTWRFFESTDNAYIQADIAVLSPKVAGYVREVRVSDNQPVRAGDVLVVIDDRDFAARVAEASAAIITAQAMVSTAESRLIWQRAVIDQAVASIAAAEAEVTRAQQDLERIRNLAGTDVASRQRLDLAEAEHRKAVAGLAKARAAHAAEEAQVAVLNATRDEANARRLQAEATLATARIDLDNTIIRAPNDGVVGNRGVQVGQFARQGAPLLSLVPLPAVHIVANFKETQLANMRPGQSVTLNIDAYPGRPVTGHIASFAPASGAQFSLLPPENATGNFTKVVQRVPVRIELPRDHSLAGFLRPGLSVVAAVDTRHAGLPVQTAGIVEPEPVPAR